MNGRDHYRRAEKLAADIYDLNEHPDIETAVALAQVYATLALADAADDIKHAVQALDHPS